jgi:hypothetical protein
VSVALLRCLGRCAQQRSDPGPWQPVGACDFDGFDDLALGAGAGQCSSTKQVLGNRCLIGVVGFEPFEPFGEFVGVVEDFLDGSGHGIHLRNLSRAGMA